MNLMINGIARSCEYPAKAYAIYALRNDLDLKGVRMGCGDGHCGACTILVDGVPTTSCDLPFGALEGKHITTPEGVGTVEHPHPVQAAILAEQPGQCGFCLSGILMRSVANPSLNTTYAPHWTAICAAAAVNRESSRP
jgi:nicotinate dehydrogenase subunit A